MKERTEDVVGKRAQKTFTGLDPANRRSRREVSPQEVINQRIGGEHETLVLHDPAEAIRIAFKNNPEYQSRKESLYLAALSVSDVRHNFGVLPADELKLTHSRNSEHRYSGNAHNRISLSKLFATGASVGISLVNDLFRFFTGPGERSASSVISANIFQPLLRGRGSKVVLENLRQTERNLIYEIREFDHYQTSFAVTIISRFYQILQLQDEVTNTYNNYKNLVLARQRAEALARDRLPAFQVDQTRQSELLARDRYLNAIERYQAELDSFKLLLGLPLDQKLKFERQALEQLSSKKLPAIPDDPVRYFSVALRKRLDFLNEVDRYDDARRKIDIAENDLLANIDFSADFSLGSTGDTDWARFNFKNWTGSAGLKIKLPLDKLRESNELTRKYISFERQYRSLLLALDRLKNDVRSATRRLQQKAKSYRIQQNAVELARRRVESADLLLRAGRATTRDLLDAQDDLLNAENALTRNLVDYYIARLQLLRDTGLLHIEDAQLREDVAILQRKKTDAMARGNQDDPFSHIPEPHEIFIY